MEVLEGGPDADERAAAQPAVAGDRAAVWYLRVLLAFVIGVGCGVAGVIAVNRVKSLGLWSDSPLAYVSIVDRSLLSQARPDVAAVRLDDSTSANWGLQGFTLDQTVTGSSGPLDDERLSQLRELLVIPGVESNRVSAVYTNALDQRSVAQNGLLLMLQFALYTDARDYLRNHPQAFVDQATDDLHDTYWTGTFAVFYAPTGAVDHTDGLRGFLKEFTWCPKHLGPCVVGSDVKNFDHWAPRATT
ncbi:hypothetical protein [Nocardioides sp.]|uniref:hypothetical protein n=1 Tax=Nocardioides sp. TaxID=35761 RepID=UPI0039E5BB74